MKHRSAGCSLWATSTTNHPALARGSTGVGQAVSVPVGHILPCSAPSPSSRASGTLLGLQLRMGVLVPRVSFPATPLLFFPPAPCTSTPAYTSTPGYPHTSVCTHSSWHLPAHPNSDRWWQAVWSWSRRVPAQKGKPLRLCGRLALTTSLLSCPWKSLADWQPRITSFSICAHSVGREAI